MLRAAEASRLCTDVTADTAMPKHTRSCTRIFVVKTECDVCDRRKRVR